MQVTWPAYQVYLYLSFTVMGTWANQPMSNMSASSEAWRWSALLGSSGSFQLHFSWLAMSGALYSMMHHKHKHPRIFQLSLSQCVTTVSQDNSRKKQINPTSFIHMTEHTQWVFPTHQDILVIVVLIVLILIVGVSSIVIMHKVMIHCTCYHHSKNCDLQLSCLILRVIPILPFCSANSLLKIESVKIWLVHSTHTTDCHLV